MQHVVCFTRDSLCFTFQIHGWNINMVYFSDCIVSLPTAKRNLDANSVFHISLCFLSSSIWTANGLNTCHLSVEIYGRLELSWSGFPLWFLLFTTTKIPLTVWTFLLGLNFILLMSVNWNNRTIAECSHACRRKWKLSALCVSQSWCGCVINDLFKFAEK